jgi:GH25 family lysozyme M1 (1,4-beta-N-acetylmuramidase)
MGQCGSGFRHSLDLIEPLEDRLLLARLVGVDVSSYQGTINWGQVKTSKQFAFIRAGTGVTPVDSQFSANATNAIANGVYAGFYYYAYYDRAGNAAVDKADSFWNTIKSQIKADGKHLMPVLDVEQGTTVYGGGTLSDWVNAFCTRLQSNAAAAGFSIVPIIYVGGYNSGVYFDASIPQNFPLWVAQWPTTIPNPQTTEPSGTGDWQTWQFWQYADNGTVSGISGAVDLDVLNGDANTLKDYIIGSNGRWDDGDWVTTTTSVKAWATSAVSGAYTSVASGVTGKVLTGPVYGNGFQRWQVQFNNGVTGWVAEDFMVSATPAAPSAPNPANTTSPVKTLPANFTWTGSNSSKYDVYLDGAKVTTTGTASWAHTTIANGTHTWRIDARNSELTTTGTTWTFVYDSVAPTASFGGQAPAPGASTMDFTVTYGDATSAVNASTFDSSDVTVTGPNGFSANASFVSATPGGNGTPRTVTYRIAAPGGTWSIADNGTYTVSQNAGQVSDTAGNARAAGTIGSFVANVPFAWQTPAGLLTVEYDTSGTPIALGTSGANVTATRGGTTLTFSGTTVLFVRGTAGADTLNLNGTLAAPLTFDLGGGGNVLNVNAAGVQFETDLANGAPGLTVNVGGAATFASSQHLASLNVIGSGVAAVARGGNKMVVLDSLSIGGNGKVDLADNEMIVNSMSLADISALVKTGYAGGAWNGAGGIVSSVAAVNEGTGVGFAPALAVASPGVTIDGEPVGPSSVLVRYTLKADANLDRVVDFNDMVALGQNYQTAGRYFFDGDFNQDGAVDFADLVLMAQQYNTSLPAAAAAAASAVAAAPSVAPAKAATRDSRQAVFSSTPITKAAPPVKPNPVARRK